MPRDPESILVLRLGGIGEVLAITPALRALRERFARSRITLLAERPACELAAEWVDDVVEADTPYRAGGLASLFSARFYTEGVDLVERLLRRKYDLFLDFHHLFAWRHAVKPFLVSLLSRAPRRIGFGAPFFLTDPVADPDDRPMVERNRAILAPLGIALSDTRPSLSVAPADQEWVDALLGATGLAGRRLIVLSPGSSRPVTRWGAERFRETALRLSSRGTIVVVGSAGERALCESVAAGAVNLAGHTTVGRLAALLGRCALLVSNDSGPLHMAFALGTPVVGIFRPGEIIRWGSYGDARRFRALSRDGTGAEEGRTLPLVTVDEVVAAAGALLDAHPPRP
jgi:ADP-heptose:LPS heptosyltransferase